jgi:hypothetical protein
MPVEVTNEQVLALLRKLCGQLGYCNAVSQCPRFHDAVLRGVDAFTDLVIWVEGLDPKFDRSHRGEIRAIVAEHFAAWGVS